MKRLLAALAPLLLAAAAARAASSDDAYRLYLRALLNERFGSPEAAFSDYQEVLRLDPDAQFVHEALASLALRLGKTDSALAEAERVVSLAPADAHSYLVLGRVRLARGELNAATAAFDKALEIAPSSDEALLYAAHIRMTSRPQDALPLYDRFLENNPQSLEARVRVAELHQRLGDLATAEASWKKALEIDPNDFSTHLALANLYEVRQDTAAAVAEYEACRFLDPDNVGILLRLGEFYFRHGRSAEARDAFDQAFGLSPSDPTLNFWLALLAEEEKDWGKAARHMALVAKHNDDPSVLLRLAYYESQSGRGAKAIRSLKDLQKRDPRNPDFMYYLALGYEDVGRRRDAARWLERVVELDPDRADAHFHLAANLDAEKKFDRAERHLLRAIDLNPRHAVALNYLGYSWAERGRHLARALELIERALTLEPDNAAFLDSLGWVYFKLGRLNEAETALGRAAARMNDAVIWEHYGDVLDALGRPDEARRAWQEGLLQDPKNKSLVRRVKDAGGSVEPLTAPRRLLKRVEGNFRQLNNLVGSLQVGARRREKIAQAQALLYYARPKLFRVEFLGPFFVPEALLVRNASGVHKRPADDPRWESDDRWLDALGEFLSGELMQRFDDPSVKVEQKGSDLVYRSEAGELRIDGKAKVLTGFSRAAEDLEFRFADYREVDGVMIPGRVECRLADGFRLSLELRRVKVNTDVGAALFETPRNPE